MNDSDHVVVMETVSDAKLSEMLARLGPDEIAKNIPGTFVLPTALLRSIISELLASRLAKQAPATHRHVKLGSEYALIGVGKMQAEGWYDQRIPTNATDSGLRPIDMREVAIYRSADGGSFWVRPIEEFNDGRFETLPFSVGGSVS